MYDAHGIHGSVTKVVWFIWRWTSQRLLVEREKSPRAWMICHEVSCSMLKSRVVAGHLHFKGAGLIPRERGRPSIDIAVSIQYSYHWHMIVQSDNAHKRDIIQGKRVMPSVCFCIFHG